MLSNAVYSFLFYVLATTSVLFAIATVTSKRILRAAVHLMAVLVLSAGFYLLLGAEFLAGVQILVYVGGIVVLLVFAVMLTRSSELFETTPSLGRILLGVAAAAAFFGTAFVLFSDTTFPLAAPSALSSVPTGVIDTTSALGRKLLDQGPNGYVLPFEIISLLLLAAAIGGIVVARKTPLEKGGHKS